MSGLCYLLYWENENIPVLEDMTIGNHLNNDLVVGGEDILDYHLRIEVTERGLKLVPLGDATISLNGREISQPETVVLGDMIGIGQAVMQVGVEFEQKAEADSWYLESSDNHDSFAVRNEVTVGRSEDNNITISDEHVSRYHARLVEKNGYVWVQDLQSANGTSVNNTAITGGAALFHGDYVSFDKKQFQLIGRGGDLTPVNRLAEKLQPALLLRHQSHTHQPQDTTEFAAATETEGEPVIVAQPKQVGAFLIGVSDPISEQVFQLPVGESHLGRGAHNDIVINDNSVSNTHVRLSIRPERVTITNLMATNGVKVNGQTIDSEQLHDGDVVRFGRVNLVFKDVTQGHLMSRPTMQKTHLWLILGSVLAASVLVWLFLVG